MNKNGKYLYCFTENQKDRYSSCRVDGEGTVYAIRHKDVSIVISDTDSDVIKVTRDNCLLHEKVLEEVMKESTVIPFEFGTVAPDRDTLISLVKDNYLSIKKSINYLRDKVEMDVVARWVNMPGIFQDILSENRHIALYKREIEKKSADKTYEDRIKIGQLVAQALYVKKEKEMYSIVTGMKREAVDYTPLKTTGDDMIFNGAFLIKKMRLGNFESILYKMGDKLNGRINFTYNGPLPPYSFTDLKLKIRS